MIMTYVSFITHPDIRSILVKVAREGGGGGGGGCNGLASRPGGSSNTPRHASCYGNRVKLRPCGPLARVHLYLFYVIVL